MDYQQKFRWPPTSAQIGWAIAIVGLLLIFVVGGYLWWDWTGFGQAKKLPNSRPAKTLWDWLDLLIVPIMVAIAGYWFTRSENRATLTVAQQRTQDEALQAYLDEMAGMLMSINDLQSLYDAHPSRSFHSVARARTLTVLPRLDKDRKAHVVQFLYEAGLLAKDRLIVDLSEADLSNANLSYQNLSNADLSKAKLVGANLSNANLSNQNLSNQNLSGADLSYANLSRADLSNAKLVGANLSNNDLRNAKLDGADLSNANLSDANLSYQNLSRIVLAGTALQEVILRNADLSNADLRGVNLSNARLGEKPNLSGADLSNANLSDAIIGWSVLRRLTSRDVNHLTSARSLEGATLPNGQKYEDWVQSKGRSEYVENSGSS